MIHDSASWLRAGTLIVPLHVSSPLQALVEEGASSLAASERAKDDVNLLQLRLEAALKESGQERVKRAEAEMMRERSEGEVARLREAEERLRTDHSKAQQEVASLRESLSASMAQSQACSPAQQRVSDLMSLLSGLADSSNVAPSSEGEVARLTEALKRATSILSFLCGELDELEGKVAEAPLRERNALKLASECLIIAGDAASLLGVPLEGQEGAGTGLEGVLDMLIKRLGALREVACRREELRGGGGLDSSPLKTG
jgi:DNA repair exonuclease SbcCD ATPase subunit